MQIYSCWKSFCFCPFMDISFWRQVYFCHENNKRRVTCTQSTRSQSDCVLPSRMESGKGNGLVTEQTTEMKLSEGATKKTRQLRKRGNVIHELYSRRSRAELSSVSDFARRVVLLLLWLLDFSPSVLISNNVWNGISTNTLSDWLAMFSVRSVHGGVLYSAVGDFLHCGRSISRVDVAAFQNNLIQLFVIDRFTTWSAGLVDRFEYVTCLSFSLLYSQQHFAGPERVISRDRHTTNHKISLLLSKASLFY